MKNKLIIMLLVVCIFTSGGCGKEDIQLSQYSSDNISNEETNDKTSEKDTQNVTDEGAFVDTGSVSGNSVVVYVCGAVSAPGVYEISAQSRIADAVAAAGGLLEDANGEAVNLAKRVQDSEQIRIPFEGEETVAVEDVSREKSTDSVEENVSSGKININTASKEQLMTLSGVGESKALAIIKYRESNGKFSKIEDIMNIEGIKEGVFNKIKDNICVE